MPGRESLTLAPLGDAEYADFAERQVVEYARQLVNAGEWTPDEAPARSREAERDLLEDALRAHGHVFLKGSDPSRRLIGWLWIAPAPSFLGDNRDRIRWLSQITVDEPLRGQGYGRALLEALHTHLAAQGIRELWLRVFNWNTPARRLYASAGYELVRQFPTDAHMRKRL
ncbi:MAG TPA: GNAT family N-acetyltransferase [Chloroflexota bacterium]|nr:GNAT family N-acetyltransferase [Chloroflexota bacterium]